MAASSTTSDVLVDKREGIMVIRLNRPQHGNALKLAMYSSIRRALEDAARDESIEVVMVTGTGQFFSTGADVTEAAQRVLAGGGVEMLQKELMQHPVALTAAMIGFPKLLVAAVNGPVVGYPAAQLGLYDLVVVSDKASYQIPLLHLGLVTEACCSITLPATVGTAVAMDLLLTGRTLDAHEMVRVGIASRVVPLGNSQQDFVEAVCAVVTEGCVKCSKSSIPAAKRLLRGPEWQEKLLRQNKREAEALIAQFLTGEPLEKFSQKFDELLRRKASASKSKL